MKAIGETEWKEPNISTIIASGAIQLDCRNNEERAIKQSRLRTVVTETMWTIWKLRNKEILKKGT
jgi:transcription elongation factor GreA-like protein